MLYLIPSGRPVSSNNKYLIGLDLIKKVDSILSENSNDTYFHDSLNSTSSEIIDSNLAKIFID